MERKLGAFAVPKAGHDRGKVYVAVGWEDGKYLLADGKIRTLEKPRRKQPKHLEFLQTGEDLAEAFLTGERPMRNEDIKRAIKRLRAAGGHSNQEVTDVQE